MRYSMQRDGEYEMSDTYGMFTKDGDAVIHAIVITAKANGYDWEKISWMLERIATLKGFEEANDTAVVEVVYHRVFEA